ncbi:MAG: Ig-like domain-containing protein [Leeuwenhoekiella sp.]
MNTFTPKPNWLKLLPLFLFILGCSSTDEPEAEVIMQDDEVPTAVDDTKQTEENTPLDFDDLMENDTVFGFARISAIQNISEKNGSITDNRIGTYTYEPPSNFIGEDSFTYTICDNKTPQNCSTATVRIMVTAASPIAADDAYQTEEEVVLIIRSFLDNDDLLDNAQVTSVDVSQSNATVTIESDNTLLYTPNPGFSGIDTFTYTICDDDEVPTCSTATITMTVIDEGSPVASDDIAVARQNVMTVLDKLLSNDDTTDDAVISSLDTSSTLGDVSINDDGTVTYTPQTGFTGQDTFGYSLCDDDETPTCTTATVTVEVVVPVAFNIPPGQEDYYKNIVFSQNMTLNFQELSALTIAKHIRILSYGERHQFLYDADADLDNPANVILMYSGESRDEREYTSPTNSHAPQTFNTEHVFPQSLLITENAVTDLHHLRSADDNVNQQRLNYPFVDGNGNYMLNGQTWFPGNEWKGDVARMMLYLNIRYGEDYEKVGGLDLFLKWNAEDPVSEFEKQRNRVITEVQGVRNPFIDNPYLVNLLWGGPGAENIWE